MLLRYRGGAAVSYYVHEMGKQSYNRENENKKVSETVIMVLQKSGCDGRRHRKEYKTAKVFAGRGGVQSESWM